MSTDLNSDILVSLTADIVSAYVSNMPVGREALPELLVTIHGALNVAASSTAADPEVRHEPAVPVGKSKYADHLVCLACGRSFTSLKRHISSGHDLSPADYRARYNLAPDYPMVTPNYSAIRSATAIKTGLGRKAAAKKSSPKASRRKSR